MLFQAYPIISFFADTKTVLTVAQATLLAVNLLLVTSIALTIYSSIKSNRQLKKNNMSPVRFIGRGWEELS